MTDEEKQAMERYGITHETKTVFHFRGHRYDRLDDAINYAKKAGTNKTAYERSIE